LKKAPANAYSHERTGSDDFDIKSDDDINQFITGNGYAEALEQKLSSVIRENARLHRDLCLAQQEIFKLKHSRPASLPSSFALSNTIQGGRGRVATASVGSSTPTAASGRGGFGGSSSYPIRGRINNRDALRGRINIRYSGRGRINNQGGRGTMNRDANTCN
jgi:hypothetical protein